MTEQEFRNKYEGKAVHCDTEEKAKELLKLAHGFGWKWTGGESLIEETYWRLNEEETCYRIGNDKKTVWYERLDFYKLTGREIVEFESEEKKVKKTKKVFDLGLFVDNKKQQGMSLDEIMGSIKRWAFECHGLTQKEVNEKNYFTSPSWMKEVEVKVSLTTHEIEVLKALKVLGFEWIARNKDGALYAHNSQPIKGGALYFTLDYSHYLNKDLFTFITWQDEEPTRIEGLLCGLM